MRPYGISRFYRALIKNSEQKSKRFTDLKIVSRFSKGVIKTDYNFKYEFIFCYAYLLTVFV